MAAPDPVAFKIFGMDVMWYGILIATGIILATYVLYRRAPHHGIASDKILDFVIICVPAGIIGARLYYVLFNWEYYGGDLFKIINTRTGGLAIHGGLIGGMLAAVILCWFWNYKILDVLDLAVPSIALAQAIGRWGNFFNAEAHGGPTDLPWAILVDGEMVHPTFLYESIWCFFLFILLIFMDNRRKFTGQICLMYGMLYSIERFFVEGLRTDSLMIGIMKQAQVISLVIFVVCLIVYIILRKRKHRGRIFY